MYASTCPNCQRHASIYVGRYLMWCVPCYDAAWPGTHPEPTIPSTIGAK